MPSRVKFQSNLTKAEERKRRQEKYRKRTRSLFSKVRLLARDTDAWVALIVLDRGGKIHSFRSSNDSHWPPSILELIRDHPSGSHEYLGKHDIAISDKVDDMNVLNASEKGLVVMESGAESQDNVGDPCVRPDLPSDQVDSRSPPTAVYVGASGWLAEDISEQVERPESNGIVSSPSSTTGLEKDLAAAVDPKPSDSMTLATESPNVVERESLYLSESTDASFKSLVPVPETVAENQNISEAIETASNSPAEDSLQSQDNAFLDLDVDTTSQEAGPQSSEPLVPWQMVDVAGLVHSEDQQDCETKPPITAKRLLASWNWIFQK